MRATPHLTFLPRRRPSATISRAPPDSPQNNPSEITSQTTYNAPRPLVLFPPIRSSTTVCGHLSSSPSQNVAFSPASPFNNQSPLLNNSPPRCPSPQSELNFPTSLYYIYPIHHLLENRQTSMTKPSTQIPFTSTSAKFPSYNTWHTFTPSATLKWPSTFKISFSCSNVSMNFDTSTNFLLNWHMKTVWTSLFCISIDFMFSRWYIVFFCSRSMDTTGPCYSIDLIG